MDSGVFMVNLNRLQNDIGEWGEEVFKNGTPTSVLHHLRDEVDELLVAETATRISPLGEEAESEAADILILLLQYAHRRNFYLSDAVEKKMKINKKRRWGKPDERGVVNHIKESSDEQKV